MRDPGQAALVILSVDEKEPLQMWTLLVTGTLTDHKGTTIIVYISRKSLAPVHLPGKKEGMMTEATIHSHLYRRHENLCFHKQAQLTILTLTCGFHQRVSRSSAFDLISCPAAFPQLCYLIHVIAYCHMSVQHFVHLTCAPQKNTSSDVCWACRWKASSRTRSLRG